MLRCDEAESELVFFLRISRNLLHTQYIFSLVQFIKRVRGDVTKRLLRPARSNDLHQLRPYSSPVEESLAARIGAGRTTRVDSAQVAITPPVRIQRHKSANIRIELPVPVVIKKGRPGVKPCAELRSAHSRFFGNIRERPASLLLYKAFLIVIPRP